MPDRVLLSVEGGVAHVRMNRPDKRNGLDLAQFEAILAAGDRLLGDESVRAVVLSGEGKAFCAGLDFMAFLGAPHEERERMLVRPEGTPANLAQRVGWIWRELPVPVIAAVQGAAFGGGLQIALGADLRYVAPDAQLSVMEIKWGLIPDMSGTRTLLELVRQDVARELTYTGRIVGAAEAVALGLATRVCEDPLAAALETARLIAGKSPEAIRAGKALWNEAPALDTATLFRRETELQLSLLGSANQLEAVSANLERREPRFRDPG